MTCIFGILIFFLEINRYTITDTSKIKLIVLSFNYMQLGINKRDFSYQRSF